MFGYASLIWRPEFEFAEQRLARVHGWHRSLSMWSHVNRGTPECPGLVFALLPGGSCAGMAFRIENRLVEQSLTHLWAREMINDVYTPKLLRCHTVGGTVAGMAFTLSRRSASYTGRLSDAQLRSIFETSCGRFGSTRDYVEQTFQSLINVGVRDEALSRLVEHMHRK